MMEHNGGHRARDPGLRLGQIGRVTWVHCPECDGPAKSDSNGVTCIKCGYMTIQKIDVLSDRWARVALNDPRCTFCGTPLPTEPQPTARGTYPKLEVRIRCRACGETVDYPANIAFPPNGPAPTKYLPLYLVTKVAGETLWVDNLAHLSMLEEYLGAPLRERGPVAGLTMMARLPAWMKYATNRPKVMKGLKHLREQAEKAGIDE